MLTCRRCTGGCRGLAGTAPSPRSRGGAGTRPCSPAANIPRHQHRDTPTTHPAHLLYGDGALADRVEGLRVVVILKVGRVVVGLGAAVILKIFVGQ